MQIMQRNSINFHKFFDCNEHVIAGMFEKMIITERKREEFPSKATHERNDVVLSWLLKASRRQVLKFRGILENDLQNHVADLLIFDDNAGH